MRQRQQSPPFHTTRNVNPPAAQPTHKWHAYLLELVFTARMISFIMDTCVSHERRFCNFHFRRPKPYLLRLPHVPSSVTVTRNMRKMRKTRMQSFGNFHELHVRSHIYILTWLIGGKLDVDGRNKMVPNPGRLMCKPLKRPAIVCGPNVDVNSESRRLVCDDV